MVAATMAVARYILIITKDKLINFHWRYAIKPWELCRHQLSILGNARLAAWAAQPSDHADCLSQRFVETSYLHKFIHLTR